MIQLADDVQEIQKALNILLSPGQLTELRFLNVVRGQGRRVVVSGYFNEKKALLNAVRANSRLASGTYITLNPVNPTLLARCANRVKVADRSFSLTSDGDIVRRGWLPIDLDPVRPPGVSSTDEEHASALALARHICKILRAEGWPEPLIGDSGNGAHILYRIDIGSKDDGLVKNCLAALALRFDSDKAKVDQGVFNPARIWKLYGTVSRKGDSTPDRPHRVSRVIEGSPEIVPRQLLIDLARKSGGPSQPAAAVTSINGFDLGTWLANSGFELEGPKEWNGGRKWVFSVCPWNPEHQDRSAFVAQYPNGAMTAGCLHNGCKGKKWADLRALVEPVTTRAANAGLEGGAAVWEPPVPFGRHDLPAFPTDSFPPWLRAFVESLAVATQTPVDLGAMLGLSVLAAASAKKFVVNVKDGYLEPVNLFTVTALPSGNRKSSVFSAILNPLEEYEQTEAKKAAPEIARSQSAHKIKESALKRLQEKASHQDGEEREKLTREASDCAAELEATIVQTPTRYIADDCTPEKLATLLRANGGRIAVMSPEGDVFDLMAGRYSANGSGNFGVLLKGHAGDDLRIDRVNRQPEFVKAPALTIGLAVQPEIIEGLAEKPGFRGRGLLGRFLYAMPASLLGRRDTNPPSVPQQVATEYRDKVFALLRLPFAQVENNESEPHELAFDSEAQTRMQEFAAWIEPQLQEFGALGAMTDWGGKLFGAVARIAGLLHLAEHAGMGEPWCTGICLANVSRAIRIGRFLISHARAAFADMGSDQATAKAKLILRWIVNKAFDSFTKRDLHQAMRSHFPRASDLDAPLALLVSREFIRTQTQEAAGGAGRPTSPTFDVNPLWNKSSDCPSRVNSEYCEYFEKPLDPDAEGRIGEAEASKNLAETELNHYDWSDLNDAAD